MVVPAEAKKPGPEAFKSREPLPATTGEYAGFAPRQSLADFLNGLRASLPKENLDNARKAFPKVLQV
ncbi:MAG: hypothetical protein QXH27_05865 [Candidatus Micrarchaeia archaeon]